LSVEVDDEGQEGSGSELGKSEDGFEYGDRNHDQQSPINRENHILSSEVDEDDERQDQPDNQYQSTYENRSEDGNYNYGQPPPMDHQDHPLPATEVDEDGPVYHLDESENGIEDEDYSSAAADDDDDDAELEQPDSQLTHSEDGFEDGFENEGNSFTADNFDQQGPTDHQDHLSVVELEDREPGHQECQEFSENGFELEVTRSENVFDDQDTAVDNFGQQRPNDFSLRVLHNVTPLPSRGPSPQPAENSPLFLHPHPRHRPSDVSTISDLEDKAAPYDVREEGAPAHRFFTPGFQSAIQEGIAIVRDVWAEVEKLDGLLEDEDLVDEATELWAFEGSDTKTIAVLGDSGDGQC
jgi:hypothetical protein